MDELIRISLENEMDLILAHKHSMKLAELTGLSLAGQTSFATAVSEVCRTVIDEPKNSSLILGIRSKKNGPHFIIAKVIDGRLNRTNTKNEGYQYAKKLVEKIELNEADEAAEIELSCKTPGNLTVDKDVLTKWSNILNVEAPSSPYEEIKRKNKMLLQLADSLKESEQTYVALTDSLPLVIFTMDIKGNIIYANKWLLEYSGESIESLNENKWERVLHPDDFVNGWKDWQIAMNNGASRTVERRLKHLGTGEYKWHTGVSIPIMDNAGNVLKSNSFLVDIDAQKKIEQALKDNKELRDIKLELEHKVEELNKSNKELEQFAYIASHDLQEPLRKINYYSDYLEKKFGNSFTEEGGVFLRNIINSADRMKQLIHDVLSYSTIRNNDLFTSVDIKNVLAEAMHDLEIAIKEKDTTINIGAMPIIDGNPGQLKQLFENLLSNSLKFTRPDIAPVINIRSFIEDDHVMIEFKDNGIGFEEKYISKMFHLFQRLHTRDKFAGTGIGLGICKKIVEVHKGEISAASRAGEGAIFMIKLPLTQLNTVNP